MPDAGTPFDALDGSTEPLSQSRVLEALARFQQVGGESSSPEGAADELGLRLGAFPDGDSAWGTRYGPWATFQRRGGVEVHVPPREDLTPDVVNIWERRACTARHPFLRYRYADLVWDLSRLARGKPPAVEFARRVTDAAVEALQRSSFAEEVEAYGAAMRALEVARSIRDAERAVAVERALLAYERGHAHDARSGTWGHGFGILVEGESTLSQDERQSLVTDMENRLQRLCSCALPELDPHGVEAAALPLARYYRKLRRGDDVRRVLRAYAAAYIAAGRVAPGSVAASWLDRVHAVLEEHGLREDAAALATELQAQGRRSVSELKSFSTTSTIPAEQMDAFVESLLQGGAATALMSITVQFTPDMEDAEREVLEVAQSAALWAAIPKAIIDEDGRTIALIKGVDEDLDGNVVQHLSRWLHVTALPLRIVLDRASSRRLLGADEVMRRVRASPVFDENKHALVEAGLRTYFAGEHAVAVHLLVPQIEAAVRRLAILTGAMPYRRHRETKRLELRSLDSLLGDERVVKVLGEHVTRYLRLLLTDPRGWNLRNEVCHGRLQAAQFGPPFADRVLHALLQLLWVERKSEGEPENSGSPGPGT